MASQSRNWWIRSPRSFRFLILLAILFFASGVVSAAPQRITDLRPTVILISIDGFRYDYLEKYPAPNLQALAGKGVRAAALIPSFPTVTFPNHYSIVTGLYPAHHGIVENDMYDPAFNEEFEYNKPSAKEGKWWGGEPIWITAHKQGQKTASVFWPGTAAPVQGLHPDYWEPFDNKVSPEDRVAKILAWLDLPAAKRPTFLSLYFEQVDHEGHENGPDSPQVREAIAKVDAAIGLLLQGLRQRGIEDRVNIIAVSDHGMAPASPERVILLDDYVDLSRVRVLSVVAFATVWPKQGGIGDLYMKLRKMPHVTVYRRGMTPARWHYTGNRRIAPVLALADEGWTITTREWLKDHKISLGQHGYDNNLPLMRAIFIAHGPAFRAGAKLPAFSNVNVYDLMAYLLRLEPAENDGSLAIFRAVLVRKALGQAKSAAAR
jgi:predicted AlkP superfamily pyrophosphatase or phosphodiesterase